MKHPAKILVIDDEEEFTDMLSINLTRSAKYEVRVENQSTNAIKTAEEYKPEIILLDIVMPGLDGGDLSAKFQSHATLRNVPIIHISALVATDETHGGKGMAVSGGTMIISKPVNLDTLFLCIEDALAAGKA
jgi:DNA-binding response OmpR family regulator